jgi:hypothetical protein
LKPFVKTGIFGGKKATCRRPPFGEEPVPHPPSGCPTLVTVLATGGERGPRGGAAFSALPLKRIPSSCHSGRAQERASRGIPAPPSTAESDRQSCYAKPATWLIGWGFCGGCIDCGSCTRPGRSPPTRCHQQQLNREIAIVPARILSRHDLLSRNR